MALHPQLSLLTLELKCPLLKSRKLRIYQNRSRSRGWGQRLELVACRICGVPLLAQGRQRRAQWALLSAGEGEGGEGGCERGEDGRKDGHGEPLGGSERSAMASASRVG